MCHGSTGNITPLALKMLRDFQFRNIVCSSFSILILGYWVPLNNITSAQEFHIYVSYKLEEIGHFDNTD
jgi:hypothetical protein